MTASTNGVRERAVAKQNGNGTAVAKRGTADTVAQMLKDQWPAIKHIIPEHVTPERLVRISINMIRSNDKLQSCTPVSLVGAILQAVKYGLEPGDGLCYIIPYNNRGVMEAQFQLGYRGVAQLVHQSGLVSGMNWVEVCENDEYSIDYGPGLTPFVKKARGERGTIIGYFAYIELKAGGYLWAYMTRDEIMKHVARFSKNGWDRQTKALRGTWADNFDAMARKTVFLQAAKLAPRFTELNDATKADGKVTRGIDGDALAAPVSVDENEIQPAETVNEETGEVTTMPEAEAKAEFDTMFPEA